MDDCIVAEINISIYLQKHWGDVLQYMDARIVVYCFGYFFETPEGLPNTIY